MRDLCLRCLRPTSACFCRTLPSIETRTHLVFLQHPRERRVAIGTARLAHLALANSELHCGVEFEDHPRVSVVSRSNEVAVLFPDPSAPSAEQLRGDPPRTLIVVDGTWSQAKKLLKLSPGLSTLPRISLKPSRPGNYRIRKEPAAHCLSTLEAVVEVLGGLEGEPQRFAPMVRAFEQMVDWQIESQRRRVGPSRHRVFRAHRRVTRMLPPRELVSAWSRLVVVYAEANAPSFSAVERFDPELIHLVARRVASGESIELFARPEHILAASIPDHVGLEAAQIMSAPPRTGLLDRWRDFIQEDDVIAAWGSFSVELLERAGAWIPRRIDLRPLAARRLNSRPGGVHSAGDRLAPSVAPWAHGRAGLRVAALEQVARGLIAETLPPVERVAFDGRG